MLVCFIEKNGVPNLADVPKNSAFQGYFSLVIEIWIKTIIYKMVTNWYQWPVSSIQVSTNKHTAKKQEASFNSLNNNHNNVISDYFSHLYNWY